MKPTHGKRAGQYNKEQEKEKTVARQFVELNTHHNITMKRKFMFEEDVHTAININTLEERIKVKRWLLKQLQNYNIDEPSEYSPLQGGQRGVLIQALCDSIDKDRHRLQKGFKITFS